MKKIELIDSFLSKEIVKELKDTEISTDKLQRLDNDVFKRNSDITNFCISNSVGAISNKNFFVYGIIKNKMNTFTLQNCGFANVIFQKTKINNSSFKNVVFFKCKFKKDYLYESNYSNCYFIHCTFTDVDLENNSYINTSFINCQFNNTQLDGSNIEDNSIDNISIITDETFLSTYYPDTPIIPDETTPNSMDTSTIPTKKEESVISDKRLHLETIHGKIFTNETIRDEYFYENCEFNNCEFSEHYINDYFIHCTFNSCLFQSAHFLFIPFDESVFKNCEISNSTTFTYCSFVKTIFTSSYDEFGDEKQTNQIDTSVEFHYCNFIESDFKKEDYQESITYEYSFPEVEPEIIEKVEIKTEKIEVVRPPQSTDEILSFLTEILNDYQTLKERVKYKTYMEDTMVFENEEVDIDDRFQDDEYLENDDE